MSRRPRGMGSSESILDATDLVAARAKVDAEIAENYIRYGELDQNILHRFTLEPRGAVGKGYWMVIWDKYIGDYIRRKDNPREYMSFKNSETAMTWLRQQWVNTTKKETESLEFDPQKMCSGMVVVDIEKPETQAKLIKMGFRKKEESPYFRSKETWYIWKPDKHSQSVEIKPDGEVVIHMTTSWYYRKIPYIVWELQNQNMIKIEW